MARFVSRCLAAALLLIPACVLVPAAGQTTRIDVPHNTRRELSGRIWGAGHWMAFCVDETDRSLNGDGDVEDSILHLFNTRTLDLQSTGLAIDFALADDDEDWPVAIEGDRVAVQVSEADQGGRDLNGNMRPDENVLFLFNPGSRQLTPLGVSGARPTFAGGKLYFVQREELVRRDLNGDGDGADGVLGYYDPATRQVQSLGMEALGGFYAAEDWIATLTSEAGHYGRDLNEDRDALDLVVQLYQVSQRKWTNTGLECSFGIALTPKLLAAGVEEVKQGPGSGTDLNNDGDVGDVVCHVRNLATGANTNTGQDCSGDLVADGEVVGFLTAEAAQGNKDLNGDKDAQDEVVQAYLLATNGVVPIGQDGSGGLVAGGGRLAFACSEADQGNRDFNRDRDAVDYVLKVYDPAPNRIRNTELAVDAELVAGEGTLAWTVLESDQANRDLNLDRDTDDSILYVMNLAAMTAPISTGLATSDYLCVTSGGVGVSVPESDQGERDLNMDRDADDEIVHVVRIRR